MEIMEQKTKINFEPTDTQKVKNRRSSTKKINELLGFTPSVTPMEGLTKYISNKKQ